MSRLNHKPKDISSLFCPSLLRFLFIQAGDLLRDSRDVEWQRPLGMVLPGHRPTRHPSSLRVLPTENVMAQQVIPEKVGRHREQHAVMAEDCWWRRETGMVETMRIM